MPKLEKWEKETLINFNSSEKMASVFTYDLVWIERLKALGCKCVMSNHFGGKEFLIDKARIKLPVAKKKVTAKVRAALAKARSSRGVASKKSVATKKRKSKRTKP